MSFREIYDFDTKSIYSQRIVSRSQTAFTRKAVWLRETTQRSEQTTAHTTTVDSGGVVVRGSSRLLNVSLVVLSPECRETHSDGVGVGYMES